MSTQAKDIADRQDAPTEVDTDADASKSIKPKQCLGVKKDGERCSRNGKEEYRGHCWQHKHQAYIGRSDGKPRTQCKGLCKTGKQCKNVAQDDGYCHIQAHKIQARTEGNVSTGGSMSSQAKDIVDPASATQFSPNSKIPPQLAPVTPDGLEKQPGDKRSKQLGKAGRYLMSDLEMETDSEFRLPSSEDDIGSETR